MGKSRSIVVQALSEATPNPGEESGGDAHPGQNGEPRGRSETSPRQPNGQGNFFAIDRRAWAVACRIGIPPAVAYLVLARGSGGDQRTTGWSVNAIEKYTRIGRPRALKAIEALEKAGLVRIVQKGSRPRYFIVPAHEVRGCEGVRIPASEVEARLLTEMEAGQRKWFTNRTSYDWSEGSYADSPYNAAKRLVQKGWLRELPGRRFVLTDATEVSKPDWIWLPNSLVDGADGEVPPIERVRQSQNVTALRVFIDLYHAHNLADDGGLNWRPTTGLRRVFDRLRIGETHKFAIWGFKPGIVRSWATHPVIAPHYDEKDEGKRFWSAWTLLETLGLVDTVPYLVEADSPEAEPMHPLAYRNGEEGERVVHERALQAAAAMATEAQVLWAVDQGAKIMVPVLKHLAEVQVVGIARLRHRPRTRATAIWYTNTSEWARWARHYEDLAAEFERKRASRDATSR